MLVVDVQRWRHPLGEYPRAEPPWRPLRDPAVEDQLHRVGPAEVEVLADHLLEEDAAAQRSVQHLGQRELSLEDRDVVAKAGRAVLRGEGMGQPLQPLSSMWARFLI